MSDLDHLVMKARDAQAVGYGALSTGEALAAALVLNRSDWLKELGYTIPEALDRVGPEWVAMIPDAARMIEAANDAMGMVGEGAREEAVLSKLASTETEASAHLVTYGNAPGYRDVSLTFDLARFGGSEKHRLTVKVNADDGESIARHILGVHRSSWEDKGPIDKKPGEKRPRWID
jgi:hypothetical protein